MHIPVLYSGVKELIKKFAPVKILDLTFGAGGHSSLFLDYNCQVVAFDRDKTVQRFALVHPNFQLHIDSFANFDKYETDYDMIFADLGMSTIQLESDRGFSFQKDGVLDMRMGEGTPLYNLINRMPVFEIERILKEFGQVKMYKKIACAIDHYRLKRKIETSFHLREATASNHFGTLAQVFQAFRIFINSELEDLNTLLLKCKPKQGVLMISFHSLEDRLIKEFCKRFDHKGFILPSEKEVQDNPKSRSAKLRFGFWKL